MSKATHHNCHEFSLRKIWSSRVPEFPEPLIPGSEIPTHQQVSCRVFPLAIITPEALNSCCMFIFLLKLTLLALITKSVTTFCLPATKTLPTAPTARWRSEPFPWSRCVLPPFYLIVLLWCACSHREDLRRLTILKKKKPHIQQKCFGNTQTQNKTSRRKGKMFQRVCSMT